MPRRVTPQKPEHMQAKSPDGASTGLELQDVADCASPFLKTQPLNQDDQQSDGEDTYHVYRRPSNRNLFCLILILEPERYHDTEVSKEPCTKPYMERYSMLKAASYLKVDEDGEADCT
ncbi:hypothetical protein llap_7363 [Limosa lapponica baueri]|uniref:Uncharacterized protein n=1 Tax=Limosa lapponica baueri TaxID=1758121 RepID=A0A2I0U8N9_LIMLA|nr:hypothetical protein llap_7363 [Limosa lapponica baueri]